jgi:hypothetical protein
MLTTMLALGLTQSVAMRSKPIDNDLLSTTRPSKKR